MPKAIIDWNSKRRRFPYMCEVCGKKYGDKKQAKTCEWADMNGTNRKAAYQNKKAKERRKDHENNSGDQLKRWSSEDNDGGEHGNAARDEVPEKCIADRQ